MNYHDTLAKLGIGVAHPGGFQTTRQWIQHVNWPLIKEVVEIGCGTGRTACHLASVYDLRVTGFDSRPLMIEKAKRRAKNTSIKKQIEFFVADAHALPVPNRSVDLVYMESVSVFMDVELLFSEIYRMLRPGGKIIDVEMTRLFHIPDVLLTEIQEFYEAKQVPTIGEWKRQLQKAGFQNVRSLMMAGVAPGEESAFGNADDWDQNQMITILPHEMNDIQRVLQKNADLLEKTGPYLAYTVLTAESSL
ncbi:methyltransferase domain-containing protein [Fodinisporobacter ferrooxydans]|uniref:Methyltransferase domain-containing protein n=1 Tax=Fodinisporobacter ferrooxydans TaxID=2901836 RepID=A0ABY4CJZ5_9BACL|nr:methyltransferase domain-containing protein [Alicyclobacillaceae bacterium MYW30-H2]